MFTDYDAGGKNIAQIKSELNQKIAAKEIDAYLIVPPNYDAKGANFEFFSRKAGDFVANSSLEEAINAAVRSQRLADANINEAQLQNLSQNVDLTVKKLGETGDEKDSEGSFAAAFVIGLMIYLTLLIYGQQVMAAVVEEKETRIAEILFSSAKPFELLLGKLVGVGLAGLTQLAIWIVFRAGSGDIRAGADERGGNEYFDSRYFGADDCLFLRLFSARIFYLRDDLRPDRFDGDDRAGRRTVCDVSGRAARHRVLSDVRRHPRSEFAARVLGFHRAVFRAADDAGARHFGNAAVLGNRPFDFN